MSLFRQQSNVTLVTWAHPGSEDFLVARVLIQRHKVSCDWLSLASRRIINILSVIKYQCLSFLLLYFLLRALELQTFSFETHVLWTHKGQWLSYDSFLYIFKTVFSSDFFIRMWAKLKGSLLEEPHLWTQDDAIKAGRHGKAKHQSELRGGSHKSENHSLLPRL